MSAFRCALLLLLCCAGVASFAGLSKLGVPGVDGGEPDVTVKVAERVVS